MAATLKAVASRLQLYRSLASRMNSIPMADELMGGRPALAHSLSESADKQYHMVSASFACCDTQGLPLFFRLRMNMYNPPEISSINYFCKHMLRDEDKPRIARSFLALMIVTGCFPDLATFSFLVKSYCKQLTYQHVLDLVFTQMKALRVEADHSFYKSLMEGVCANFGPYVGFLLLRRLRLSLPFQLPLYCYDAVVGQLCKRKMIGETSMELVLINVFKHMKRLQVFPDYKIYECLLKGRQYHADMDFLNSLRRGSQMFAQGIRIGAVVPTTAIPRRAKGISRKKKSLKVTCNTLESLTTTIGDEI